MLGLISKVQIHNNIIPDVLLPFSSQKYNIKVVFFFFSGKSTFQIILCDISI